MRALSQTRSWACGAEDPTGSSVPRCLAPELKPLELPHRRGQNSPPFGVACFNVDVRPKWPSLLSTQQDLRAVSCERLHSCADSDTYPKAHRDAGWSRSHPRPHQIWVQSGHS